MKLQKGLYKKILRENFITKAFILIALLQFALLFYYALGLTGQTETNEYIVFHPDNILMNVLLMGIVIAAAVYIKYGGQKIEKSINRRINMNLTAIIVSIAVVLISIYWLNVSCVIPGADQEAVCTYASFFNRGNFEPLERGGYVAVYRQQLGIITFIRILFRLFGDGNFRAFQYFSAIMTGVLCYCGYYLTKTLSSDNRKAELYYLIFIALCIPMYTYVPYVYGEISSTALLALAACILVECLRDCKIWKLILLALACGFAVQMRMNSWIFIIGFLIAVLVKLLSIRSKRVVLIGVSIIVGIAVSYGVVNLTYHDKIPEDSTSMPPIMFVAMGTNYDNEQPGWYNFYNWNTFRDSGWDVDIAKERAWDTINAFRQHCKEDPLFARKFYTQKMLAQWEAPMFEALIMNNRIDGVQSPLAKSIYQGVLNQPVEDFMNIYELMVYGGVLFLLIKKRKRLFKIENYAVLIGIVGGFLFTLVWEAKTRYVLPYFLMMLPYAATGIGYMVESILKISVQRLNKN